VFRAESSEKAILMRGDGREGAENLDIERSGQIVPAVFEANRCIATAFAP
jgi:hypothetical protein